MKRIMLYSIAILKYIDFIVNKITNFAYFVYQIKQNVDNKK